MQGNILNYLFIDAEKTIGTNLLAVEAYPYFNYQEGVRGEQKGTVIKCLSETMHFEKIDIKVEGLMQLPFELNEPVPVVFDELCCRLWQDFSHNNEIKLSITAKCVKPVTGKRVKLTGGEE